MKRRKQTEPPQTQGPLGAMIQGMVGASTELTDDSLLVKFSLEIFDKRTGKTYKKSFVSNLAPNHHG